MKSPKARILKEARALFWPWCAITSPAVLRLLFFPPVGLYFLRGALVIGFSVGLPLMAALSLGNEFQHRTLPLLLSQPIDRGRIWAEKWIVLLVAVLSAAVVYWFGFFRNEVDVGLIAGLSMVVVCSAMFWTLVAKSTIGGLALNAFPVVAILIGVSVTDWLLGRTPSPNAVTTAAAIGDAAVLGYALLMLWLGRRKLEQFQATGESGGADLLMTSPNVLRCRPMGPLLNLIRKEVRLLWPVWLLMSMALLLLLCMTPFRFMSQPSNWGSAIASVIIFCVPLVGAVLSGSLSMGEERTLGTHSWHITMPVSVRRQWFTKLVVAILTSTICSALVINAGRLLIGPSLTARLYDTFGSHPWHEPMLLALAASSVLTLAAFWCACAVKGTVRAALWVFPVIGAGSLAYRLGMLVMFRPTGMPRSVPVLDFIISSFHPFPIANTTERAFFQVTTFPVGIVLLAVPLLLVTLLQSYQMFRREVRDSVFSVIRYLLPPLAVIFLMGFFQVLPVAVMYMATTQTWSVLDETSKAIGKMQLDTTKLDAAHPLQLTLGDLAKTSPPSDIAQRWLRNATITVTPKTITRPALKNGHLITQDFAYFSTVQLKNNWSCSVYGTDFIVFSCTSPSGRWGFPAFP